CCRVEDLDAGIMFAVERGVGIRTSCLCGIIRRIEPKPEVIHLHGIGLHASCCLWDDGGRRRKLIWPRRVAGGNNEILFTEAADKIADAGGGGISGNVAHIPRGSKRRVRNLNYEKVEVGVRR